MKSKYSKMLLAFGIEKISVQVKMKVTELQNRPIQHSSLKIVTP
jgi:hypothetical protein